MSAPKRKRAGLRMPGHDYTSRCIYHIILHKEDYIPAFSTLAGEVGSHDNPPHTVRSPLGEIISRNISRIKEHFPFVSVLRRCVMPDHVHFAIYIKEKSDIHLGSIILQLKTDCRHDAAKTGILDGSQSGFKPGYYDVMLLRYEQLQKMLAYISDNPKRLLMRRQYPGWFRRFTLVMDTGEKYEAFGNWDLFSDSDIEAVRVSRRFSKEELHSRKRAWLRSIHNCGVLVSPFISKDEMKVRDYAEANGGNLIYLTDELFVEKYKPHGRLFDLCTEGRIAIVSVPTYHQGDPQLSREDCLRMNALAERIVSGHCHIDPTPLKKR